MAVDLEGGATVDFNDFKAIESIICLSALSFI